MKPLIKCADERAESPVPQKSAVATSPALPKALFALGIVIGCFLLSTETVMAAGSLDEIGAHLDKTTTNVTDFAEKYLAKIVGTIGVLSTGFLVMRDRSGSAWKASLATTCVATVIIKYAPKVVTGLFGWV